MQELRIDEMNNDIVIVAKNRSKRPMDKIKNQSEEETKVEYDKDCPFCRGNENDTTEERFIIEDKEGWLVKSVDNKFPIVDDLPGEIYGLHEVMIDTYRHNGNFYNMNEKEFENLIKMYKNRYTDLICDEKIEYVSIFKNFLRKSGASLMHPHSQIISLSMIPPDIKNEINISKEYYNINKRCLYEDTIKNEIKYGKRIIHNDNYFLVIVPYATKYSGEVRIIFKEKIKFEEMSNTHIKQLSKIFKNLFKRLYEVNGYNPFNLCIHTHPSKIDNNVNFNVHIHIIPRKYSFGGFELSTGIYVSSINPEDLAQKLKF
ncbi:MAG: galactose-1-phosphate uridylyltransferase [Romboutsia sp.]|uniref:galactose-1-phosphate uridylyltransferase n=1 Tax=Romboutsia sp. TaxID=1965302 RepID=UPI003F2BAA9B